MFVRVFSFLFFISLACNIYQYRFYQSKEKKYQRLKINLAKREHRPLADKQRLRKQQAGPQEIPLGQRPPRISRLQRSQKVAADRPGNLPKPDGEAILEELTEHEHILKLEEEKREWDENIQNYFTEDLSLSEDDFQVYQQAVARLKTTQVEIYRAFVKINPEDDIPHIPSFEEQSALFRVQEQTLHSLGRRLGEDKVKRLLEYERQMKLKMIEEKGHYNAYGLF